VAARVVGDGCCKNLRMREISGGGGGGQQRKRGGGGCNRRGIGGPLDRDPRPNLFSRLFPTPAHKSNKNSTVLLVNAS
jgi:hypothetical protein